jgi:hypothetical protein
MNLRRVTNLELNVVKDERGDLLADPYKILKNYF